jgi:hypothetical protein
MIRLAIVANPMEERRQFPLAAHVKPIDEIVPSVIANLPLDVVDPNLLLVFVNRAIELYLQERHRTWVVVDDVAAERVSVVKDSPSCGSDDFVGRE